jgi:hypothetical protein
MMATSLNSGFHNNINTIQLRSSSTSLQRVTDRTIDFDGDGRKETPLATDPPSPSGVARTIIATAVDTDGGVEVRTAISTPYTTGVH